MTAAMTSERNEKIRLAHTGRKRSSEQRARMSAAVTAWWAGQSSDIRRARANVASIARTSETFKKISLAVAGCLRRPHTSETKAKQAASARARWTRLRALEVAS